MSKYSTKGQLQKRLYEVLREEESHEDRALELAERWNEWRIQMREKERFLLVARERADVSNGIGILSLKSTIPSLTRTNSTGRAR